MRTKLFEFESHWRYHFTATTMSPEITIYLELEAAFQGAVKLHKADSIFGGLYQYVTSELHRHWSKSIEGRQHLSAELGVELDKFDTLRATHKS